MTIEGKRWDGKQWVDRKNQTKEILIKPDKGKKGRDKRKKLYYKQVWMSTEASASLIPDIEMRGWHNYHIDHIYPISKGFINGKSPEEIADVSNLRMLPWRDNIQKGNKIISGSLF